ncbi:hypothetical protein [Paenibacillus sp. AN1007]|uniref:Pre-toxin TG domain-containing protein n=1 Tax=Paenibacillus sp. AN1007 TaxID=3151385 RepID=A0AAU8N8G3_9BACL
MYKRNSIGHIYCVYFQDRLQETASLFRSTDSSGEEVLRLPEELGPSFTTGLIDKAIGDTVTGIGETIEAFLYNPCSTLGSLGYDLTVGKIVDVGRGIGFAWDTAWGTGTARSDIEQFVNEQKKQLSEDESGYYKGAVVGQALSYFLFGKALHSKGHHGSGGSGDGKKEPEKGNGKERKGKFNDRVITKTNKGMEVEFVNPHGNKIKWVEQNPKNIPNAIESAKNSSNSGKAIEGKVGDYVLQKTDAIGFGLKLEDVTNKKIAGDIDVLTNRQIIEVKKSFSALDMKQIDKYTNPQNPLFFNYEGKEVIVYIDEALDMSNSNVINTIQELKGKDVTVVNSLDELGGVLK